LSLDKKDFIILKFLAFSLVGAIGTLVHFSILYVLVESLSFNPILASGCGASVGLTINYFLNYLLTFKSHQSHAHTFPKYALITLLGFCLNLSIMMLLANNLYYIYAQILTTGVVLIWNFLANNFWTFRISPS